MILYFSATGNTEYAAGRLAALLEDDCINLLERIKKDDHSPIGSDRPFVICAPVYVCEMPRFLASFLAQTPLTGAREVYFVFTSGGYTGIGGVAAKGLMRRKGLVFKGYTQLKMPRNYIASNAYPELDEEEIGRRISAASDKIPQIASIIREGGILTDRHVWLFEKIITYPFNPVYCRIKHPVKPFRANDKCISCGKCARLCPLNIISMENGKPVWTKKSCAHCMSCIQNCPVEAIDFGDITQTKKRYLFGKYKAYCTKESGL